MEMRTTTNYEISDLEISPGEEEPKFESAEKDLLATLQDVLPYLEASGDMHTTLAVMIPPAQQLRNAADALEKKDKIILRARYVVSKYTQKGKQ